MQLICRANLLIILRRQYNLGFLCASPLIIIELFGFISPALLETEKRHSVKITLNIYTVFGRSIDELLYTLSNLIPILGNIFCSGQSAYYDNPWQLYIIICFPNANDGPRISTSSHSLHLGKYGVLQASQMAAYRKYALIVLAIIAAIIPPPIL